MSSTAVAQPHSSTTRSGSRHEAARGLLTTRAFLVGLLLTSLDGRVMTMAEVHRTLMGMGLETQMELQVRAVIEGRVRTVTLKNVTYMSERLKMWLTFTPSKVADADDDASKARHDTIIAICDALLQATLIPGASTALAIDGTGIWAWAKGRERPVELTEHDGRAKQDDIDFNMMTQPALKSVGPDPDASWGAKTRKDGNVQGYFGYELHAAVNIPKKDDAEPIQVQGLYLTPASTDLVAPTLSILDRIQSTRTITDVLVDRHYSHKAPQRWADELRQRGISQHLDLRKEDGGFRDHEGIRMAAGWAHCPATPDELGTIPRPGPGVRGAPIAAFLATVERRQTYAMRRVNKPTLKGNSRWQCPALDGRLGCSLRDGTEEVAREAGLPIIINPPARATAPKCCTQETVQINEPTSIKLNQPHYWGSERWLRAYQRRTYVEGFFGSLKAASTRRVGRGQIQVHGIARNWLLVTVAIAAANIRHARIWHQRTGLGPTDHPVLAPAPDGHSYVVTISRDEVAAFDRELLLVHNLDEAA